MPALPPTPDFWASDGVLPRLLQPFAWVYTAASAARQSWTRPWRAPVPVICIGNLTVGGAGKTPVALSLADRLQRQGHRVHILSRGYGGALRGPVTVDLARHDAAAVGDEALLLGAAAPAWVARARVAGARAAAAAGATLLLLDDGLQNPTLTKDLALAVVDGGAGFGNRRVLPAGPLREPLLAGLARCDAVVLMGRDEAKVADLAAGKPLIRARLVAENAAEFAGRAVFAFAGIGRPGKFFATLEAAGAQIVGQQAFPDHHTYGEGGLDRLAAAAAAARAALVTTAKDAARLSPAWRARVGVLRVSVAWEDEAALDALIARALARP